MAALKNSEQAYYVTIAQIVPVLMLALAIPEVSTEAKLLDALDAIPLSAWQDRIRRLSTTLQ